MRRRFFLRRVLLFASVILFSAGHLQMGAVAQAQKRSVRVRVFSGERLSSTTLEAGGGKLLLTEHGSLSALHELRPGERARLSIEGGQVVATLPSGALRFRRLRVAAAAGGTVRMMAGGNGAKEGRSYTGFLNVDLDPKGSARLRLINEVELEEYVASVLPKEYPFEDREGSKALAVVIRTYALTPTGKYGNDYDLTDDVGSQVYHGAGAVTPLSREAARATAGEVLTYKGKLIQATHYASSGGYTASNEDVWQGTPLPYLRARLDPHDVSPHRNWEQRIPKAKLLGVLTTAYGKGARVIGLETGPRGADGRVKNVVLVLSDGKRRPLVSNEFRMAVSRNFGVRSLRSTNFTLRQEGDTFVFQGKGFGHGVGLNQWGAHEMALRGRSYRDILLFYYSGVVLERYGTPSSVIRKTAQSR